MTYRLPIAGPRPVKQADHAVVEDIEKTGQCMVVMIQFTVMDVIGDVQRHGTLGAEQSQKVYHETGLTGLLLSFKALERGRCKSQGRFLAKLDRIVRRAGRVAQTGFVRKHAFHPSDRLKEAESDRVLEKPQI